MNGKGDFNKSETENVLMNGKGNFNPLGKFPVVQPQDS